MNEFLEAGFGQLIRVSLVTSISVTLVAILIRFTRLRPSTRVVAWLFVLLQSWFLYSIAIEVPWYEPIHSEVANSAQVSFGQPLEIGVSHQQPIAETANVSTFSQMYVAALAVWILGGLFLIAKYVLSYRQLQSVLARCPKLDEISPFASQWKSELDRVRRELGVSQPVQFRLSQKVGPLICRTNGQYSLVVPESVWSEIPESQRLVILQHELSHLKRGDVWRLLLARLLILPQWFNPLAWLALRRFDAALEMACDDYVLERTSASRVEYAKSLVSLIEFNHQPTGMALAVGGPPVRKRIQRIVQPKGLEMKFARMLTIVSLFAVSLFGLLKLELVAQENSASTTNQAESTPTAKAMADQLTVDQAQEPLQKSKDGKTVVKTYYVGDLVAPRKIPNTAFGTVNPGAKLAPLGGGTAQDFFPVRDLIKQTVAPETWKAGGTGKIELFVPNLSLIIESTNENHAQIEDLLTKFREIQAVTIELDSYVVIVPEGHELAKELTPEKPSLVEEKVAQRYFRQFASEIVELPKGTLYIGQMMTHRGLKIEGAEVECLSIQPLLTVDLAYGKPTRKPTINVTLFCNSAAETVLRNGTPTAIKKKEANEAVIKKDAKASQQPVGKKETTFTSIEYKPDPVKITGLIEVPSKGYARFDVTGFLKNPKKGTRAVAIVQSTVVYKRDEIAKLPKPKVLDR